MDLHAGEQERFSCLKEETSRDAYPAVVMLKLLSVVANEHARILLATVKGKGESGRGAGRCLMILHTVVKRSVHRDDSHRMNSAQVFLVYVRLQVFKGGNQLLLPTKNTSASRRRMTLRGNFLHTGQDMVNSCNRPKMYCVRNGPTTTVVIVETKVPMGLHFRQYILVYLQLLTTSPGRAVNFPDSFWRPPFLFLHTASNCIIFVHRIYTCVYYFICKRTQQSYVRSSNGQS